MAPHCSILTWEMPWTKEPGRLYSPWGHRESRRLKQLRTHAHTNTPPLSCFCRVDQGFYGVERSRGRRQSLWRMESSQWRGPCLWEGGTHLTAVLPQTHTLARGGMQDGVENPPRPRCPQEQGPTSRGQMATAFLNPHLRGHSYSWFFCSQAGPPKKTKGCQPQLLPCVIASSWEVPGCWNPPQGI